MKKASKTIVTFILFLLFNFLYLLFIKKELTMAKLADGLFLSSLFFLIVGTAILILSSGQLDNLQKSNYERRRRKEPHLPEEFTPYSQIANKKYRYWYQVGILLLLLSLLLLIF